jgi:ribonuclease
VGLSVPEQKPAVSENVEWEEPTAWAYTTLTYDAASRIIARTYPDGTTEHTTYDALGRIVRVQHGARTATYAYDRCSRLIRMSDNSAGNRRFIYDAAGQLVTAVDALGYRTHFEYDAAGQMVRTLDATGQVTTYIYDAAGQLIRTVKGAGSTAEITSTYTYDAAGRLLSENNGERTRAYSYDYQGGGLLASLSVNGVCAAEYSYSPGVSSVGHRTVTVRDYASASALRDRDSSAFAGVEKPYLEYRFVYDSSDRLISRSRSGFLRSDDQSNAHADDDIHERLHALNTFIKTGAYTLTYSYDADGYLITSVTPYAKSTRTVDGAGRTVAVTTHATGQPAHDVISSVFSYDPLGRLTRIRVGDMVSSWTHERTTGLISDYVREQVLADVRGFEESKVLERTQVIRDHNGRVIGLDSTGSDTSQDGLVLYSYDDAGQLVGARSASHVWEWEYTAGVMMRERVFALDSSNGSERSAAGSRVLEGERIFTHNEANQLVAVEARAYAGARGDAGELAAHTITEYAYNLAGERSGEVTTDKLTGASYSREYSWGAYGGLTSVTDSISSRVDISHTSLISDAVGEVSAVSDGEGITVPLMWDARSGIPHLLGAGATSAPSSDGGFSQAGIPGGVTPWHTLNVPGLTGSTLDSALGSTPGLPTDWGVPSASATPVPGMPTGFEFTGAGSLRVAGLDMLGARVYDSPSRRFLSTDPKAAIAGSSWFADVYAYAGNNPLEYVDPRGERPMTVADYRKYQSQEGERFMQQSLRLLALVGVIGSLFIAPTSILLAGGVGFISGAANGAADGMDFHTPDGNIDWDKVQAYALQEGGKEALTAALIGMLFKAGPPVARATGNQAMKVPVISRTVDRVKTSPVVIKTQNTVNAVKTRINGIQYRIATWTRTSLLGIEHVVPKVHPTPHNSPHQIDIPNGPKPTHTDSLDHRTSGTVHEPNVQLKPVEEPKVENLPPAKGLESDSPSLEKPATDGKHASWVEHPPGSKLQNGDQTATYLAGDEFKKTLVKSTKDSSRYVPSEEPGTYNVYGFDEAKKLEREYYIKLNGGNSPADLSKGKPEFALWRPEVGEPNLDTAMTSFRDVTRHGNTVEAQVGSHKFMVTNLDEYTGTIPDDVVPTAKSLYETGEVHWTGRDYKPEGFGNVPDPLPFDNKEARILPTHDYAGNEIDYTKYRVRRLARTANQVNDPGAERLIVGSNGSMYYTPDHYKTFVRIF